MADRKASGGGGDGEDVTPQREDARTEEKIQRALPSVDLPSRSQSRIKKIMQKDTEVGRIAMAVPVIISRALEMFLKSLLTETCLITQSKLSTVVSVAHMKQCIESEKLFHFLKEQAERASTAAQRDNRGVSMWPLYRTKRQEISVKKPIEVGEKPLKPSRDSLDNDASSSESELFICL